ncbi:MAG: ArsR/SmtB family transcription factor [Candidatus Dormibacteria bacterium]
MIWTATEGRALPEVLPSAPSELLWVGSLLLRTEEKWKVRHPALETKRAELVAGRLRNFWDDGVDGGVAELVILASLAGRLFSEELDELLRDIPAPTADPGPMRLQGEDPEDRLRMIERVRRLSADPKLRRRYGRVLLDLWDLVREEWQSVGLAQVRQQCTIIAERLARGMVLEEAAPSVRPLLQKQRGGLGAVLELGIAEGTLVLVPTYFGDGWSIWDLPHQVVVGVKEEAVPLDELRASARVLAPRLRALGDPTRLNILLYLAQHPTSVGELARTFGLAQPTVSAHVRSLREALLVVGKRSEGRTEYELDRSRLGQLLQEVASRTGVDSQT